MTRVYLEALNFAPRIPDGDTFTDEGVVDCMGRQFITLLEKYGITRHADSEIEKEIQLLFIDPPAGAHVCFPKGDKTKHSHIFYQRLETPESTFFTRCHEEGHFIEQNGLLDQYLEKIQRRMGLDIKTALDIIEHDREDVAEMIAQARMIEKFGHLDFLRPTWYQKTSFRNALEILQMAQNL